jgi:uncharacterized protein YcaQ
VSDGSSGVQRLRLHAVSQTLFNPTDLGAAIERLGFVQADPIRSPARSQDLILRHRVKDYRAGDLERRYSELELEEDLLYAYGFLPRNVCQLLHPRKANHLRKLEQEVLAIVRRSGPIHPDKLLTNSPRKRVVNAWGGYSKATKVALERLHYQGLLRVAGREKGIRIYEPVPSPVKMTPPGDRACDLIRVVVKILAPIRTKTLHAIISRLQRGMRGARDHRPILHRLIHSGELEEHKIDHVAYIWPAGSSFCAEAPRLVRILAPFDPLVWDRNRFEHLWQWPYRFEAYTPPTKRIRGYYAMPLLWCERVIGWANAEAAGKRLSVELGFAGKRPSERDFCTQMDAEIARLRTFLSVDSGSV